MCGLSAELCASRSIALRPYFLFSVCERHHEPEQQMRHVSPGNPLRFHRTSPSAADTTTGERRGIRWGLPVVLRGQKR